jgi:hypothetical protein
VITAVTARLVARIQTIFVVQIQVLIAVNLVKLAVRGIVVNQMSIVRMVCAGATHLCVKVISRRHLYGTARNMTVAVLRVLNAGKPVQSIVLQQEQEIALAIA